MSHETDNEQARRVEEQRKRERLLCSDAFRNVVLIRQGEAVQIAVNAINFNCYGMAIFAGSPIAEGDVVSIALEYDSTQVHVEVDRLLGEVIYCNGSDVGFYAGIAFVSAQVESEGTLQALECIEADLRGHQGEGDRYGGLMQDMLSEP